MLARLDRDGLTELAATPPSTPRANPAHPHRPQRPSARTPVRQIHPPGSQHQTTQFNSPHAPVASIRPSPPTDPAQCISPTHTHTSHFSGIPEKCSSIHSSKQPPQQVGRLRALFQLHDIVMMLICPCAPLPILGLKPSRVRSQQCAAAGKRLGDVRMIALEPADKVGS
jgi:hypothetical protein